MDDRRTDVRPLSPLHTTNNVEAMSNATKPNVASTLLLVWTGALYTLSARRGHHNNVNKCKQIFSPVL